MPEPRAQILRSSAELEAFVPAWTQLWHADPHATPFQHPAWLIPWWHHFGEAQTPAAQLCCVILTSFAGNVLAFLPFYLYPEPTTGERKLLLLGVGTTDYLDGLFAPACTVADVLFGLTYLCAEAAFDTLYATQLRQESPLTHAFMALNTPGLHRFPTESCGRMQAVSIAGLPVKIRRNALYYRNRAQRLGNLTYTLADASSYQAAFDNLERLHTERWQARGESGVLADPAVLATHREALPLLADSGLLRLGTLRLNYEVMAVLYSLIDPPSRSPAAPDQPRHTQYFYLTAFSAAHADLRPGTLLLACAIEHAATEGVHTIDMLRGEEGYKELWHLERFPTCGFSLPASASPKP